MNYATKGETLACAIENANDIQLDALWAILKYKSIGIFRKLACMCEILGVDFDAVVNEMPQEDGRVLDKATRYLIHSVLIEISQERYERER